MSEKKKYTSSYLAHDRYDKENTKPVKFKFNKKTDADIIAKLQSEPNKQGYVKRLIREDIARNQAPDSE